MTIKTTRTWNSNEVREACIRCDFYTMGDNKSYSAMLDRVDELEPTPEALYEIALDIVEHSDDQTVENVMFCLERYAVSTFYKIED